MASEEIRFANDARAAIERPVSPAAWLLLGAIAIAMAGFVTWAAFAQIEQTTTGSGRVIPSSQVQSVESLEPGIVAEIMVRAGDRVEAGQPLIRIDDTGSASRLGELRQREIALAAELARLEAQASDAPEFAMPPDAAPAHAAAYRDQSEIFEAERRNLEEQLRIRRQQLIQKKQNLAEAEAAAQKQSETLDLVNRELELTRALYNKKAVPEIDLLRIERQASELRGDLRIWDASKLRLAAEVEEAEALLQAVQTDFKSRVRDRASKVRADLAVVTESLRAAEDRVRRAILPAPVAGIVNKVNISGVGEVVQAGVPVAEIVPVDDTLLIEARIRPQDIAFIRPGLPATIRLTAYDYTRFGTLPGTVERIGADTITDENRETFYQVIVRTDEDRAQESPEIEIIPGMVATVDIRSGDRTVLNYLLKPVLSIRDSAFREPQ